MDVATNVIAHNQSNVNSGIENYEERRRKLLAPFPIIRIASPRGNSQAPNNLLTHTHIEDGEY